MSFNSSKKCKPIGYRSIVKFYSKIVANDSNFYLIIFNYKICTFEKFLNYMKYQVILPSMLDKLFGFCIWSYMQKIYVISKYLLNLISPHLSFITDTCMCFNIKSNKRKYVASIKKFRNYALYSFSRKTFNYSTRTTKTLHTWPKKFIKAYRLY